MGRAWLTRRKLKLHASVPASDRASAFSPTQARVKEKETCPRESRGASRTGYVEALVGPISLAESSFSLEYMGS